MPTELELRGLSMEQLEQERFGSYQHYQMVREHAQRVRDYEVEMEMKRMRRRVELLAEQDEAIAVYMRARKNAQRAARKKAEREYVFTNEQMRIAIKSIERHAE
jgi:nitrogen-specific signal transduction histidine kinase